MGNFCCHCGQAICDCVHIEYDRLLTRAETAEARVEEMEAAMRECVPSLIAYNGGSLADAHNDAVGRLKAELTAINTRKAALMAEEG